MAKPIITEIDSQSGEITQRELTAKEIADRNAEKAEMEAQSVAAAGTAAKREAVIAALAAAAGLEIEEVKEALG